MDASMDARQSRSASDSGKRPYSHERAASTGLPGRDAADSAHFGFVLWALRLSAGLSRAKLAKRAGIAEATIKFLEAGKGFPSNRTLYRLMSVPALRLTPAILQELFSASSLVDVEYAIERPARVTPDQRQIVLRLTLTFKEPSAAPP